MDAKDHDLLVELSTKMSQLCKVSEKNSAANIEAHEKIIEKIDKNLETTGDWVSGVHIRIDNQLKEKTSQINACHKTFLQSRIFYWAIGFILAGFVSIWAAIAVLEDEVDTIQMQILIEHSDDQAKSFDEK